MVATSTSAGPKEYLRDAATHAIRSLYGCIWWRRRYILSPLFIRMGVYFVPLRVGLQESRPANVDRLCPLVQFLSGTGNRRTATVVAHSRVRAADQYLDLLQSRLATRKIFWPRHRFLLRP